MLLKKLPYKNLKTQKISNYGALYQGRRSSPLSPVSTRRAEPQVTGFSYSGTSGSKKCLLHILFCYYLILLLRFSHSWREKKRPRKIRQVSRGIKIKKTHILRFFNKKKSKKFIWLAKFFSWL